MLLTCFSNLCRNTALYNSDNCAPKSSIAYKRIKYTDSQKVAMSKTFTKISTVANITFVEII